MSDFASLSGVRIVAGSVTVPLTGMWSGDVTLAGEDPVPNDGPLVLGNLTLAGHVFRQAPFSGARACRLVAGAGGWRQVVPRRQYSIDAGVRLKMVLGDAATEVGERIVVPTDTVIGNAYVREFAQASRVLRHLVGTQWYIDTSGTTQVGAWPSVAIASEFTVLDQFGGRGEITIATEDYASWLPNATFTGPTLSKTYSIGGVRYVFEGDGRFRLEVLTNE